VQNSFNAYEEALSTLEEVVATESFSYHMNSFPPDVDEASITLIVREASGNFMTTMDCVDDGVIDEAKVEEVLSFALVSMCESVMLLKTYDRIKGALDASKK
jgi:hypothetical protein